MLQRNLHKIVVTGGAGFIGSHIVDKYIENGHSVVVIDNLSTGKRQNVNPKARLYIADIIDKKTISNIFKKESPDIVSHHAAQVNLRNSITNPIEDAQINILGFLSVLEAARSNKVSKFIFASSAGAVYGNQVTRLSETSKTQPLSPYGVAKKTSEMYLDIYLKNYGLQYISLRYSNVYGPRQNVTSGLGIIGITIDAIINNKELYIFGDGKQTRDFIHVEDIINANCLCIDNKYCGVLNIATSKSTNLNELIELISKKLKKIPDIKYVQPKIGEQINCILNNEKARKILKWIPKIQLEDGIAMLINRYKH